MNLKCPDCAFSNSEVSFGGEIQKLGKKITLQVTSPSDLDRQIIKSDSASLHIPKLQLEIPRGTQKGTVSTIEGFLKTAAANIERDQPERLKLGDIDNFHRCRQVVAQLISVSNGGSINACPDTDESDEDEDEEKQSAASQFEPFEIILDDPAGNSYIENLHAPAADPNIIEQNYSRTPSQDMSLGLQPSESARQDGTIDDSNPQHKNIVNSSTAATNAKKSDDKQNYTAAGLNFDMDITSSQLQNIGRQEVLKFPSSCPNCSRHTETDMCVVDIPHFKEVVIMSLFCESCGYKSNEIKGGGAIPKFGTNITLSINGADDLAREVLKSDTAGIEIPEIDMVLQEGGLDGVYTTVEGLLNKLHKRLTDANPFGTGDSATKQHRDNDAQGGAFSKPTEAQLKYKQFLQKLKDMADGVFPFPYTLIIPDPLSNSFIGPIPKDAIALALQAEQDGNNDCYDAYEDNGMTIVEFERTEQQNEDLGLLDMKTENYQEEGVDGLERVNYGTDQPQELPDRLSRLDHRGPDHPHEVGKAPVEGDNTVMGAKSSHFAVPGMQKRGTQQQQQQLQKSEENEEQTQASKVQEKISKTEKLDKTFIASEEWVGPKTNQVFRSGALGVGYYADIPLDNIL